MVASIDFDAFDTTTKSRNSSAGDAGGLENNVVANYKKRKELKQQGQSFMVTSESYLYLYLIFTSEYITYT